MSSVMTVFVLILSSVVVGLLMYTQHRANKAEQALLQKEQEEIINKYNSNRTENQKLLKGAREEYEEAKRNLEKITGIKLNPSDPDDEGAGNRNKS